MKIPGDVLRTSAGNTRYFKALKGGKVESTFLATCKRRGHFTYWFVTHNEYPYDRVASKHDLLAPKRKFACSADMTKGERDELEAIKRVFGKSKAYDSIIENVPHHRTIRDWYHLHLIQFKGGFKLREYIQKTS